MNLIFFVLITFDRGQWRVNDPNGRCWCRDMWAGRAPSSDGIRFCYGTVSVLEKITSGSWALELSACWLFSSVQLLPQCCLCNDVVLVCMVVLGYHISYSCVYISWSLFPYFFCYPLMFQTCGQKLELETCDFQYLAMILLIGYVQIIGKRIFPYLDVNFCYYNSYLVIFWCQYFWK